MASKKNSQEISNPYLLKSVDSIKFIQSIYFDTGSNNAASFAQKMEIITLICFLTQVLNKKDPEKYPDCLSVLSAIFDVDLKDLEATKFCLNISADHVRSFGYLCDNLMWGTTDDIAKPDGFTNAKEIKNKIINYFVDEWSPF